MKFFNSDDNSIKENFENSEQKINKTESCVLFSPSTALSQLNLNTPKKISKIRKRYRYSSCF